MNIEYVTKVDDSPDWRWAIWDNATGWDPRYTFRSFERALCEHHGNHMSTIVGIQIDGKEWRSAEASETFQNFAEREAWSWLRSRIATGAPEALRSYMEFKLRGDMTGAGWDAYYASPEGQAVSQLLYHVHGDPFKLAPKLQWVFSRAPQHFARLWYQHSLVAEICALFPDLEIPYGGILPFNPRYRYILSAATRESVLDFTSAEDAEKLARALDPHASWTITEWVTTKEPDPLKPWQKR